jgi:hypothetical protein
LSIYKPKNSSFFYYDFVFNGVRYYGPTKSRNRREAQKIETLWRKRVKAPDVNRATRNKQGEVYFLNDGEAIKIGWAANTEARAISLQTATHRDLEVMLTIPGTKASERVLHERFAEHRIRPDREWFRRAPEILEYIGQHSFGTE